MVLSVLLTGCGNKQSVTDVITEQGSKGNVSLSMWVVSDKDVDDDTANAVTAALNNITEETLKTRLYVNFLTKDEYEAKISEAITNYQGPISSGAAETTGEGETTTTQTTQADQSSGFKPIFPELLANQVDVIYIEGEGMYTNFVENGWLEPMEALINANSANKPLKEYVSSAYLNAVKLDGKNTYAIPNTNTIGDYTYMLLNKELMDESLYNALATENVIKSFFSEYVYGFLDAVSKYAEKDEIVMIDGTYEECLALLAYFWNVDDTNLSLLNEFSLFGQTYGDAASLNRGSVELGYGNLFADEAFAESFLKLNEYNMNGYFGDAEAAGKDAAIKFVTCDMVELDQYTDEYYPIIVKYPTLTEADLFDNGMFAVCSKSINKTRSMEIVTYINTNAEFRNILYYGVEGVHFEKQIRSLNGVNYTVAYKLNNNYNMSMAKTGNILLVYPTVDVENPDNDMDLDIWEYVKDQNFEAKIDPLLGFELGKYAENVDTALVAYVNGINADLIAMIAAEQAEGDLAGLKALVAEIAILLDATSEATADDFVALKDYVENTDLAELRENLAKATSSQESSMSAYSAYKKWLSTTGFKVAEK